MNDLKGNNNLKGFSFPVLSDVSLDYLPGVEYSARIDIIGDGGQIIVSHKLTGNSIVAKFLKEQKAFFGCVISLPATMYRRVFVCKTHGVTPTEITAIQDINYEESGYNESLELPQFRAVIIKNGDDSIDGSEKSAGLEDLWQSDEINFPSGSIIGDADWKRRGGAMGGFIIIKADPDIPLRSIKVELMKEQGFRFRALVHPSFYKDLDAPENPRVWDVYIHIFSRGLEKLAALNMKRKEWEEFTNLKLLAALLIKHGQPLWDEDEFHPETVATIVRPYKPIMEGDEHE